MLDREDLNAIAAVLRQGINEGTIQPGAVRLFGEALCRRSARWDGQDFMRRSVPSRVREAAARVTLQREAPEPKVRGAMHHLDGDAALFVAILRVESPAVCDRVQVHYVPNLVGRFSVGRIGAQVHIRFGSQAVGDSLVETVCEAAAEAQSMLAGATTAVRVDGR